MRWRRAQREWECWRWRCLPKRRSSTPRRTTSLERIVIYDLDLNHDGTTDFVVKNVSFTGFYQDYLFLSAKEGSFIGRGTNTARASALRAGGTIGASRRFHSAIGDMAYASFLTQGTLNSGGLW